MFLFEELKKFTFSSVQSKTFIHTTKRKITFLIYDCLQLFVTYKRVYYPEALMYSLHK